MIYKIVKANEIKLKKKGLRIDWWGRMYTVINLPEEVASNNYSIQPFIVSKLREFDELIIELNLLDTVFPTLEKVGAEEDPAYLLVLEGPRDEIILGKFFKHLAFLVPVAILLKILITITINNWEPIGNFLKSILELI